MYPEDIRPGRRARRRRTRSRRASALGRDLADPWVQLGHTWQRLGLQLAELGTTAGIEGLKATAAALSSFAAELHWHADRPGAQPDTRAERPERAIAERSGPEALPRSAQRVAATPGPDAD